MKRGRATDVPVQAVDRAVTVLILLAGAEKGGLGVSELARAVGISKGATHRLLVTLQHHRFVQKNPEGRYQLGWGIFEVGSRVPLLADVRRVAHPMLVSLSRDVGETANLAIRDGREALIIDSVASNTVVKLEEQVGVREPLHATALGKALLLDTDLSGLREIFREEPLERFTPRTKVTVEELAADLAVGRQQGYTLDDEEFYHGVRCVGVPVRNFSGNIVAAISVSGPAQRLSDKQVDRVVPILREVAVNLSACLGYRARG